MTLQIDSFTGGIFDTNCFFLKAAGILIDAPQETADWLLAAGHRVRLLLLTHGHIDHTWDAARIQREHNCRLACHPETVPMVTQKDFFRQLGLGWDVDPATVTQEVAEGADQEWEGIRFDVLLVPGHCPGSLCFLNGATQTLFGGDVLFAGGVGRWDLPGGDRDLLFEGIRKKIYTLDGAVRVLPGHGPATTVGQERRYNPFVGMAAGDAPLD